MNGLVNGIGGESQQQAVSYGGVNLPNCSLSFSCRGEYDSSNRVLQGYAITFRGNCIVTDATTPGFVTKLKAIQNALAKARGAFVWTFAASPVFNITPTADAISTGWTDRRWGPKPRVLSTKQITAGRSARIEFEIECFVTATVATSVYSQPTDFEELSWTFSYTFDRNFVCTRTVSGVYKLRSPLNAAAYFLPDGTFFPSLPGSFYRDSIDHQLSADGSTLHFSVTDKEVWRTLPKPLTEGDCHFKIQQEGAVITKSLTASFTAPNDINKRVILQFLSALVKQKFPKIGTAGPYAEWLTHFSIDDDQFSNRVSLQVSSRMCGVTTSSPGGTTTPKLVFGSLTELGWSDIADITPNNGVTGDEFEKINGRAELRSMLGTAKLIPSPVAPFNIGDGVATLPDDTFTASPTAPPLAGGPTSSGSSLPATQTGPTGGGSSANSVSDLDASIYSSDHKQYPYVVWEESVSYILDHHLSQIPVMAPDAENVVQQTARAEMRVVQIGHARRLGAPVVFPAPLYCGPDTGFSGPAAPRVAREDRRPGVVRVLADGVSQEYSASWVYEVLAPNAHKFLKPGVGGDEGVNVAVPTSPIFSDDKRRSLAVSMDSPYTPPNEDGTFYAYPVP